MSHVFRIEVYNRHETPDSSARSPWVQAAHQIGITALKGCQNSRVFFLKGDISPVEAAQIGAEMLADSVVEQFIVGRREPAGTHTVDITLQPGVTDPIAENLIRAAKYLGIELEQAASGQRFDLTGDLSTDELETLATRLFSNPVIQRHSIDSAIEPPFIEPHESDGLVETIPLREANGEQLLAISKERRLSLDLNEMKAVQDWYVGEGREPRDIELEMIAQTWSEHCVHKTFRALIHFEDDEGNKETIDGLLKHYIRAATEEINKPWVRSAFVDNAGIVAFDDEYDIAFKVETHNHPSALEPFGGANTGVGGVVRDILGVSAKPIANTDVLCFGYEDIADADLPEGVLHPRRIADGVIHGIEDYGNKMGIPTVNGAILYDSGYTANPLVYCGCLGILPRDSHRTEPQYGDYVVVLGGRTGRDGLRGATFSSMEIDTSTSEIASISVQIGHPINEKQVQEVIVRARDEGLYNAITDCGAGGLSSAIGEMGEDLGADVQLEMIPLKYPGLRPWEIWLSEAQERMVMAVSQDKWERLQDIAAGQDVEITAIGLFGTEDRRLILRYGEDIVGDITMELLHECMPRRELQAKWQKPSTGIQQVEAAPTPDLRETLLKLLAHPNIRSKEDVVRRYDHEVQGGTVVKPFVGIEQHVGGDAAVVVPLETKHRFSPLTLNPSPTGGEGLESGQWNRLDVPPDLRAKMKEVARRLRRESTRSEGKLWGAIRGRKLDNRKFRRQQNIGAFVVDFFCPYERLVVEVDGPIHEYQKQDDALRQEILESLGLRFVRVTDAEVEQDLPTVLEKIRSAFTQPMPQTTPSPLIKEATLQNTPSPLMGEGEKSGVRGIALSVGICPQYGATDPYAMAWAAVDEAFRNLVAVGADPDQVSLLDNFCWGNPNLPDRLGSLVLAAKGCHDAAIAYNAPFISGKDSLNNEYADADGTRHAIPGTLLISAMGIVPDVRKTVTMDLKQGGNLLYVIGETHDEMGGSHYNMVNDIEGGTVPQPNENALETMRVLHRAIQAGLVQSCHDTSEGGLAVALAEMCIASGLGVFMQNYNFDDVDPSSPEERRKRILFSESSGRFIVEISPEHQLMFENLLGNVAYDLLGEVIEKQTLEIASFSSDDNPIAIALSDLEHAYRGEVVTGTPEERPEPRKIEKPQHRINAHWDAPRVLILHANGTNRDHDAALACELAGGAPEIVHVNQLMSHERYLMDYHMLVVPGGFSYGDDLGAGQVWAQDLRYLLRDNLVRFAEAGRPILGICNGFQVLLKSGLLPDADFANGEQRDVTLTYNEHGHFECRWVYLKPNLHSTSLFTDGLEELIYTPVAHGEGRVMVRDEAALNRLWNNGQVALTYVDADGNPVGYPGNPNGSISGIAAINSPGGNVMGLMPHPEDHIYPWQHPRYHRGQNGNLGLAIFRNGIKYA